MSGFRAGEPFFGLIKSDAEKAVDKMYGGGAKYSTIPEEQTNPYYVKPLNETFSSLPSIDSIQTKLSDLWANVELKITPESTGEALVNSIYGYDENGKQLLPPALSYDPATLATPNVVTKAKGAVTRTLNAAGDAISGAFLKYGIIAVLVLLAAVILYSAAGGYGRRLAS